MRVALVGPDGAGKTSVAAAIREAIPEAMVIYAGKNRNHYLPSTTLALKLWNAARRTRILGLALLVRFGLFYPCEYGENLIRVLVGRGRLAIYDRHPVDRMILAAECKQNWLDRTARPGPLARRLWLSEYPLLQVLKIGYQIAYPRFDLLCFLLPTPDLLQERAHGQYAHPRQAANKRQAYLEVAQELSRSQSVLVVEIDQAMSLAEVTRSVMAHIGLQRL